MSHLIECSMETTTQREVTMWTKWVELTEYERDGYEFQGAK